MKVRQIASIFIVLILLIALGRSATASSAQEPNLNRAGTTELVSVSTNGVQGNGASWWSAVSNDGRFVAFQSEASNLVDGDTNDVQDVFLRDRQTGETTRVSVASNGDQGWGESGFPDISAFGRYIVFQSVSKFDNGDLNGFEDIYLHDQLTHKMVLVSVAMDGTSGNGWSRYPSISADGRYVAFQSTASNLVIGDDNGVEDIFVRDILIGETTRVSVASDGTQGNQWSDQASISPDGLYVAFRSYASNLVQGDVNNFCDTDQDNIFDDNCQDIFLHNRLTGETIMVSVASDGSLGNNWSGWPSVSANGRYVAFKSWAEDLVENDTNGSADIFVHDTLTGETTRVSVASNGTEGDCYSDFPSISTDGRLVAFESCASNLVDGDTNGRFDVFVHDRYTGRTSRVSLTIDGMQADSDSERAHISAHGRYVAFDAYATNLVPGDTNAVLDVFVHDRGLLFNLFLPVIKR